MSGRRHVNDEGGGGRQPSWGATEQGGERGRTIAIAMVLACCRRGCTRRRGPGPATVVFTHDNLNICERARIDAHDIRVLAVGICAAVGHERQATR